MFTGSPCWLSICCTQGTLLSPMATALSRQERTTMQAAGHGRAHQTNTTRNMGDCKVIATEKAGAIRSWF